MSDFYDRQGNPLTMKEWVALFEKNRDIDLKRVAETTLPNRRWVSTVWLGLDHRFGAGAPLIFETMAFESRENMHELDSERYSTEAQAVEGHARMCEKWLVDEPVEVDR